MQEFKRIRSVAELVDDLNGMSARFARLRDQFAGLAVVFSTGAGMVLVMGLWTHSPLYAVSAAFALAASVAFALAANAMTDTGRAAPRVVRVPVAARIEDRRSDRWAA